MTLEAKKPVKARALVRSRAKPKAHAENLGAVWVVNGRMVSKTIADPEVQKQVQANFKKKFPTKAAVIKEFQRRGMLTPTGKLTKAYGG